MTDWAVGIDPSTKCLAFVAGDADIEGDNPDLIVLLRQICRKTDKFSPVVTNRAFVAVSEFAGMIPTVPGDTITFGIERGIVGRGGVQTSLDLGSVSGALMVACQQLQCSEPLLIPISRWKKELTGNGGANKDFVAEHIRVNRRASYERLCQEPGGSTGAPRQDLLDALGVQSFTSGLVRAKRRLERTSWLQG
jgi:Holliday junction resolvasome RuvABC endonuclease subunit